MGTAASDDSAKLGDRLSGGWSFCYKSRMRKSKRYEGVAFDTIALRAAEKEFEAVLSKAKTKVKLRKMSVNKGDHTWTLDKAEEFYAMADHGFPEFQLVSEDHEYMLAFTARSSEVAMFDTVAPTRDEIESVFAVLESHIKRCQIPDWREIQQKPVKIFIGHGHDEQWKLLKDHLHEKQKFDIQHYDFGARAGHTIRDILTYMLEGSSLALLVMTGEDKLAGKTHARQNVIHEAGLFQGKLGFERAIVLLEDGTEEFSNLHGLQQVRFTKGNIAAIFGEVVAVIRREFPRQ